MKIIKGFVIAFSIYSKIPVPQFDWKEEDMQYHLCFFPLIGLVIGALEAGWFFLGNAVGDKSSVQNADSGSNSTACYRWLSYGWIYGYHGCISFLSG